MSPISRLLVYSIALLLIWTTYTSLSSGGLQVKSNLTSALGPINSICLYSECKFQRATWTVCSVPDRDFAEQVRLIKTLAPGFRRYAAALLDLAWSNGRCSARIISARRTAERNAAVGGKSRSLHLKGEAVDLGGLSDEDLRSLGRIWESWGGRYGGNFSEPSPRHFDSGNVR
jgi:hypothetical protein